MMREFTTAHRYNKFVLELKKIGQSGQIMVVYTTRDAPGGVATVSKHCVSSAKIFLVELGFLEKIFIYKHLKYVSIDLDID